MWHYARCQIFFSGFVDNLQPQANSIIFPFRIHAAFNMKMLSSRLFGILCAMCILCVFYAYSLQHKIDIPVLTASSLLFKWKCCHFSFALQCWSDVTECKCTHHTQPNSTKRCAWWLKSRHSHKMRAFFQFVSFCPSVYISKYLCACFVNAFKLNVRSCA